MDHGILVLLFAVGLFLGMLILLDVGRRIGAQRLAEDREGAEAGVGAVDGAVFALLGLLIAFTFSGAATRFDTRRQLIVEETNDIGTAYLRLDLLAPEAQPGLREKFRELAGVVLTPAGVIEVEQAVDRCEQWAGIHELTDLLRRSGRS